MSSSDYVLENYIAVDSAKPPDLLFPYTNNGAESYHSHMNAEFYVKHPNIYVYVDVLKKDSTDSVCFHEQHVTTGTEVQIRARENSVCGVCLLRLSHTAYYKKGISEESMLSLWTKNRSVTVLLELILFSCVFIHFCRAVSYITQMRFHHQLMRFHKTASDTQVACMLNVWPAKCQPSAASVCLKATRSPAKCGTSL